MPNFDWERLKPLQLGRYAEYYAKMEFASYGFEIYTSEVDDHGIDFIAKKGQTDYYDVQVKSVRGYNYIFFQKDKFILRPNLLAVILVFFPKEAPKIYLIPSTSWSNPNALLVSRDYEGKKSNPEWGLNLSTKNKELLNEFEIDKMINNLWE
jgi:hypothetical protein